MLQGIFGLLMGCALGVGFLRGRAGEVAAAMLEGAREGISAALGMAGGFAFFCGLTAILRRAGAVRALSRAAEKPLRRLMGPSLPESALEPMTLNLVSNLLGLGNAATPAGIEAARRMAQGERATPALCLFLVINSSSVQLLPTSVMALRAAAGSRQPGAVILPTLIATAVSTLCGVIACKAAERLL